MSKQGKVLKILSPTEVVVSLGSDDGVSTLSEFLVYALGEEIKDPDTKESLGVLEVVRGRGDAKHVQPRMTTVRSSTRRKEWRDRRRQRVLSPMERITALLPAEDEIVSEEVEVTVPFVGVQVGDLVREI